MFKPYINRGLSVITSKQRNILFKIILAFSLYSTIAQYDILKVEKGYSFAWLALLYTLGAIIKIENYDKKLLKNIVFLKNKNILESLIIYNIFFVILFFRQIFLKGSLEYINIEVLLLSIISLIFASNLKIYDKFKNIILFFSQATFGIYISHTLLLGKSIYFYNYLCMHNELIMINFAIAIIILYLVCILLERIRKFIVEKIVEKVMGKVRYIFLSEK